ncbi:IS30 family transposase [Nocardia fluminea]
MHHDRFFASHGEWARNGGRQMYRAVVADSAAFERARRPKPSKLAADPVLCEVVAAKLGEDWSPQQIAWWLRRRHPGDVGRWISHESIYRDLYTPSRKSFDSSMFHRLRSERPWRRPRRKTGSHGRGRIRNMVSIHDRPGEADTRTVAGHWEGDLVFGTRPSAVATLVDRATRYTMVVALPDCYRAESVATALIKHMGRLPESLRRSATWDRGREMAAHTVVTAALSMPVYFCDPHHRWQRGTNENTNRLLRRYLHKNADLSALSEHELDAPRDSTIGPAACSTGPPRPRYSTPPDTRSPGQRHHPRGALAIIEHYEHPWNTRPRRSSSAEMVREPGARAATR